MYFFYINYTSTSLLKYTYSYYIRTCIYSMYSRHYVKTYKALERIRSESRVFMPASLVFF